MEATQNLTGNQMADQIMQEMSVRQLQALLRIGDLVEAGKAEQAALYLRNLPEKDRVKLVGYYAAKAAGDEDPAI